MTGLLDEIVATKRTEIEALKLAKSTAAIAEEAGAYTVARRPFRALFEKDPVLIAEIKPKSPSAGELTRSPLDVAELYAKSEADVISVLTDEKYFGGSLQLLKDVHARVPQTILRKDFIVDEYQVYETLLSGADAFLLIAAVLSKDELSRLAALGKELGLATLVEVHNEADLEKALGCGDILGINNRNLKTLKIDLATTERLGKLIPSGTPFISESGISTVEDVQRVKAVGARGILVGTSILQSPDPIQKIAGFKQALSTL